MKKINRKDISKELYYLHYCQTKYRALFELFKLDYESTNFKILKWLIKSDMDSYYQKYQKFLHRYEVVKCISFNFHKFITGITKKDFKSTDKLEDLLNRMKFQEDLEELKFNYDEVLSTIEKIKVNYEKSKLGDLK